MGGFKVEALKKLKYLHVKTKKKYFDGKKLSIIEEKQKDVQQNV